MGLVVTTWTAPLVFPALHHTAATGHQVKDQNNQSHNQQNMDEAAGKVKAET
jgi:hypothetical protein